MVRGRRDVVGLDASILMHSTGIANLTVNGSTSNPMQLDFNSAFKFFIGTDQAHETYRIEGASIVVTGIKHVTEPATGLAAVLGLGLVGLTRRRRKG